MDRPRRSQDRIIELLREAELRLVRGESLASVSKSLGISESSYRRWRMRYGDPAKTGVAGASDCSELRPGVHPISKENLFAKGGKEAGPRGEIGKFSEEANELLDEANGASDPARNAWLAFLALLTYLLVTLASVSHKNLLLNSPVQLPVVNVDIPLFSFFQYAPALLLLVYLSLLIQHVILARKFREFTEAIAAYERETQCEHPARELVHSYVVSQILAGPKPNPIRAGLMRLMVFVTFALLPIGTLLYFQVKFLPYHEVWITYWHRIAVLFGLAMLFVALPLIHLKLRKREVKVGPQAEAWRASPYGITIGAVFATLVIGFSWLVATVPEEVLDRRLGFVPPIRAVSDGAGYEEKLLNPLVSAAYQRMAQVFKWKAPGERWLLRWLVSYRVLVVEDTDLVPDESDKQDEVSVVLRERDLRFARLSRSDLHRADLTKADLRGAVLRETRLEKTSLTEAQLQGADLLLARLEGADLRQARLEGALLAYARLEGAYLGWVRLQSGAMPARLQRAALGEAHLQGAVLWQARLQGANLAGAELQGADLRRAQLQGADLRQAQLQGADLRQAQLQGADLEGAQLHGADLNSAGVWLARFSGGKAHPVPLGLRQLDEKPLSADRKAELTQGLEANITDSELLQSLRQRLDQILRDDPPTWEADWLSQYSQATDPAPDEYVPFLIKTACEDPGGYIVISMADRVERYTKDKGRYPYAQPLAEALRTEPCAGAKVLTNEERARLKYLSAGVGLPQLGAELNATSVSGLSSGAYMAGQLHVAHSQQIVGIGIVAGGPYACAESPSSAIFPFWPLALSQNAAQAVNQCLQTTHGVPNAAELAKRAKELADKGAVDPLGGLAGDKVYLFHGQEDGVVAREVIEAAATFYKQAGLSDANIVFVEKPAGHAFLTEHNVPAYKTTLVKPPAMSGSVFEEPERENFVDSDDREISTFLAEKGVSATASKSHPPFSEERAAHVDVTLSEIVGTEQARGTCGVTAPPFINDCDYDQARAIVDWIYGSVDGPQARPSAKSQGRFIVFDQRLYAKPGDGLADEGIIYVPPACDEPGCRVHIALHGCEQSRYSRKSRRVRSTAKAVGTGGATLASTFSIRTLRRSRRSGPWLSSWPGALRRVRDTGANARCRLGVHRRIAEA
jgi:uncharacterized protein YjbI with pentapeptide repeats